MRNLLDTEIKEDLIINCMNGYILENTSLCICYKGWTTNSNSLNECDVDSGENSTNIKANSGVVYSNNTNQEKSNVNFVTILIYIFISILVLYPGVGLVVSLP